MKSPAAIAKIADPRERIEAASKLLNDARDKANDARSRRDMAALVLIEPFERAVAPVNEYRAAAKRAFYGYYEVAGRKYLDLEDANKVADRTGEPVVTHAPTIGADEYNRRLAKSRADRAAALEAAGVTVIPKTVYKDILGISRGLFIRMMQRAPAELPHIDNPEEVAKAAHADVVKYDRIAAQALAIREEVTEGMLNGSVRIDNQVVKNADIARWTDLTTARVAQMRLGVQ